MVDLWRVHPVLCSVRWGGGRATAFSFTLLHTHTHIHAHTETLLSSSVQQGYDLFPPCREKQAVCLVQVCDKKKRICMLL